jgi:hypothetical protein
MAAIDLTSGTAGAYGSGELQLQGKVQMTTTPTAVTDNLNVASPLLLATNLVKVESTLRITTNDNPYIDAEDGAGNNRFTVGRVGSSQQVNVDFASNPTGSTTAVGAIRTYRDGTNLSEAMTFIEDGSVGIGTTAPIGLLHLYKAAATTRMVMDGDAGQSKIITYRTAGLQRFGLYVNNTAESGANAGSNFAIRAYSDAGTLLSTPLFIQRSTGNVGIGTTTPERALNIVSNSPQIRISDTTNPSTNFWEIQSVFANTNQDFFIGNQVGTALAITSAGNVGIGTTTPLSSLHIEKASQDNILSVIGQSGYEGALFLSGAGSGKDANIVVGNSRTLEFHTTTSATPVVSGTAQMVLTSAGNVGIGTTTPTTKLMVEGTGSFGTLSNEVRLQSAPTFVSGTLNAHLINADGSGAYGSGNLLIQPRCSSGAGITNIVFATSNNTDTPVERFRITANGVTFNGDTAAANALDDYEEGTWTMGVAFGGGTTGITYSNNTGTYTKIGRQVTVNGLITITNKGTSTGSANITGLPFSIGNSPSNYGAPSLWIQGITFTDQFEALGIVGSSEIQLAEITNAGAFSLLTSSDFFTSDVQIAINYSYFV